VRHAFPSPSIVLLTLAFALCTRNVSAKTTPVPTPLKRRLRHSPNPAALAVTSAAEPATSARAPQREPGQQPRATAKALVISSLSTLSTRCRERRQGSSVTGKDVGVGAAKARTKSPRAQVAASAKSSIMAITMRRPRPHPTHKTKGRAHI
jgi:hypothetical protein